MEEKIETLSRIHTLQKELISYQTSTLFRKIIKKTTIATLENLRDVEIGIAETEIELPDPSKWPIRNEIELSNLNVDATLNNYTNTLTALEFLK